MSILLVNSFKNIELMLSFGNWKRYSTEMKGVFMILIGWIKRWIFMYKLNKYHPLPNDWNDYEIDSIDVSE